MLFDYPEKTRLYRKIPKNGLYDNTGANTKLKNKFVNQVGKIIRQFELAPKTLNLDATKKVPAIHIFDIHIKTEEIDQELLEVIDKAIPLPIIFQIYKDKQVKVKAAYKRPPESTSKQWVIESYFESDWLDINSEKSPMPTALDLSKLYEQILKPLMPDMSDMSDAVTKSQINQTLGNQVAKIKQIEKLQKEIASLEARRDREKQFNRKVEINQQLKLKTTELDKLT